MQTFIKKYQTIIKYLCSSGLSFIIDLTCFSLIFWLLKNKVHNAIIIASFLARGISSLINYLVNRYFVFEYKKEQKDNSMLSYFILVIINITVSSILVNRLYQKIPFNATLIKAGVDGLIFIVNYFLQKLFIFKSDIKESSKKSYFWSIASILAIILHLNSKGLVWDYNITDYLAFIIWIPIIYYLTFKNQCPASKRSLNILSFIFSICMLVGYSFQKVHNFSLIYQSDIHILVNIIKLIGYYELFKRITNLVFNSFINHKFKDVSIKFAHHPFLYSLILLTITYGMYLLFYYPGVINYDNANQIKEVLGLHTRYLDSIIVLDPNVTLTNFNPIIHTLLLGNLFKLGLYFNNANLGLFMYTMVQELIVILTLAYSIHFLSQERVNSRVLLIVLLCYLITPFYPFYALTAVKDTLFTCGVMLYLIYLYKYMKYPFKWYNYLIFFGIMLSLILLRNNGVVLILASLPFTIFMNKTKSSSLVLTSLVIIFLISYNALLPIFNIPNTSIREGLSVPFQQTARYVLDYEDDVTKDEKAIIDKILEYDTLTTRYNPGLSDQVKNKYNKYATKDDLNAYFQVWGKMFFKHPDAYINATLSNSYGYFYPLDYSWYIYSNLNQKLPEAGYDYHFNSLSHGRLILKGYANGWMHVPVLRLFVSCGLYTWIYIFLILTLILTKKKKYLILLMPAVSMIFMCFIGPANTYFRYCLPYASTLPLILCLILGKINKTFSIKKT